MEQIILSMRNRKSTFWRKAKFFGSELQSSVRISHGSESFGFHCWATPIIITSTPIFATYRPTCKVEHSNVLDRSKLTGNALFERKWVAKLNAAGRNAKGTQNFQERVLLRMRFRVPLRTYCRVGRSIFTEHLSEKITCIAEVISVGYNFQAMFHVFRLVDVSTEETN